MTESGDTNVVPTSEADAPPTAPDAIVKETTTIASAVDPSGLVETKVVTTTSEIIEPLPDVQPPASTAVATTNDSVSADA